MINLKPKTRCPICKMLYWRKHKCQRKITSNISPAKAGGSELKQEEKASDKEL